jgi:CRP-like cAMP-binding protein
MAMTKQSEFGVLLGLNPLFSGLGADSINKNATLCHTQYLAAGEMLFQKGDRGDALFGIRRGQIRIETGSADGGRVALNFLGAGDLFGEIAVLDGQTRTAVATAGEPIEFRCPSERFPELSRE